ncbi:hypothetical protein AB0D57_12765 [Streptomyces sp. NPDC048275]|uniref:hypothetical protein n=1 Tax=Streptomyces sp. NPDC048275 TaxID=3155629 RepID=UPI0033EB7EE3
MKPRLMRTITGAAATALALGGLIAMPGTASAATDAACSASQNKEFDTVGQNYDVSIKLCVYKDGNDYKARAYVSWGDGGLQTGGMEKFNVQVRLEHDDADKATKTVDYSGAMNYSSSGDNYHTTDTYTSTADGGWTADGTVTYNIDLDGDGDKTWALGGSPSV